MKQKIWKDILSRWLCSKCRATGKRVIWNCGGRDGRGELSKTKTFSEWYFLFFFYLQNDFGKEMEEKCSLEIENTVKFKKISFP